MFFLRACIIPKRQYNVLDVACFLLLFFFVVPRYVSSRNHSRRIGHTKSPKIAYYLRCTLRVHSCTSSETRALFQTPPRHEIDRPTRLSTVKEDEHGPGCVRSVETLEYRLAHEIIDGYRVGNDRRKSISCQVYGR